MIIVPKGYTHAIKETDIGPYRVTYIGFYDETGELVGIRERCTEEEFFQKFQTIVKYKFLKSIPQNVRQLQQECAHIMYLMECVFDMEYYALTLNTAKPEWEKTEISSLAVECRRLVDGYSHAWASLNPLWMGHEYGGMKYHGENPYKFKYTTSVPCMYEKDELAIALGQTDFEVGHILKGKSSKTGYTVFRVEEKIWDEFKKKEKIKDKNG